MREIWDMIKVIVKIVLAYVAAAIVFMVFVLALFVVAGTVGHLKRPKIHEVASPLEASVVRDLCLKLDLPTDDPLPLSV